MKLLELPKEKAEEIHDQLDLIKTPNWLLVNTLENKYAIIIGQLDSTEPINPTDFIPNMSEAVVLVTGLNNQLKILKDNWKVKEEEQNKGKEEEEIKILPTKKSSIIENKPRFTFRKW